MGHLRLFVKKAHVISTNLACLAQEELHESWLGVLLVVLAAQEADPLAGDLALVASGVQAHKKALPPERLGGVRRN